MHNLDVLGAGGGGGGGGRVGERNREGREVKLCKKHSWTN